ncbi:MAG: hypothetical protein IH949_05800 [Bacteroidetes bacterium]|nr:hypothetical protein [Bacteroidota bacterium]
MEDKIEAIKVNLIMLLKRIEEMRFDEQVNYEIEQKVNEINQKIYEIADLFEEIEAIEEL